MHACTIVCMHVQSYACTHTRTHERTHAHTDMHLICTHSNSTQVWLAVFNIHMFTSGKILHIRFSGQLCLTSSTLFRTPTAMLPLRMMAWCLRLGTFVPTCTPSSYQRRMDKKREGAWYLKSRAWGQILWTCARLARESRSPTQTLAYGLADLLSSTRCKTDTRYTVWLIRMVRMCWSRPRYTGQAWERLLRFMSVYLRMTQWGTGKLKR